MGETISEVVHQQKYLLYIIILNSDRERFC
jgi:hypothetical protein